MVGGGGLRVIAKRAEVQESSSFKREDKVDREGWSVYGVRTVYAVVASFASNYLQHRMCCAVCG